MSPHDATADQLIAAGYGDVERRDIPADWQTRRPPPSNQRWKDKRKPRLAGAHKSWRRRRALYILEKAAGEVLETECN